jgi:hypothetical protein
MNKIMDENVKYIKHFLKKYGGLMITNRQVGKSQALIELLHENEESYIITFNYNSAMELKRKYVKAYKDGRERHGIVIQNQATIHNVKNGYIDEYFFHDIFYKQFKGAVSTMAFPIEVKKFKNNPRISNKEMKSCLTGEEYAKEHSLKFK